MNKLFQFCVLFGMCIFLYACPYESAVPVDSKPHAIDTVLLGRWRSEKIDTSYYEYTISRKTKTQYAITAKEIHADGYNVQFYSAYYSRVDGDIFLSIFSKDTSKHGFSIMKINLASSGNTLKASYISDKNKETFSNPGELRTWIVNNKNKPDFFDSTEVKDIFHRVK